MQKSINVNGTISDPYLNSANPNVYIQKYSLRGRHLVSDFSGINQELAEKVNDLILTFCNQYEMRIWSGCKVFMNFRSPVDQREEIDYRCTPNFSFEIAYAAQNDFAKQMAVLDDEAHSEKTWISDDKNIDLFEKFNSISNFVKNLFERKCELNLHSFKSSEFNISLSQIRIQNSVMETVNPCFHLTVAPFEQKEAIQEIKIDANESEDSIFSTIKNAQVRSLNLNGSRAISQQNIRRLLEICSDLEELDVGNTILTADNIISISKIHPNLKKLNVSHLDINDEDLLNIAKNYKSLRDFDLRGCQQITREGVCRFIQECPTLKTMVLSRYFINQIRVRYPSIQIE